MLTALLTGDLDYATILPFLTGAAARGLPVRILAAVTRTALISWLRGRKSTTSKHCAARKSASFLRQLGGLRGLRRAKPERHGSK